MAAAAIALLALGCGDFGDTIVIDGQQYGGSSVPLELEGVELIPVGFVEEARNASRVGLPLFALPGVDPSAVVLVPLRHPEPEVSSYITYISDEFTGGTLADVGLCPYIPSSSVCADGNAS